MAKIIPEEEYENYIDQIEQMIQNGSYKYQIVEELDIPIENINKIIEGLNDKTSSYYNVERYQKLLEKIRENFMGSLRHNAKFVQSNFSTVKLVTIKSILNGEYDLQMASNIRKKSIVSLLLEFSHVQFDEYYEEIQQFLKPYGFAKEDNQIPVKKKFNEYPKNTKEEFLLLALTYRVSFKSMAKLLNTTVMDITNGFLSCHYIKERALDGLLMETLNESKEEQEQSYQKAKQYLHRRNTYIQKLNQYTKEKNEEKASAIKEMIRELHHKIDDYNLKETLKKDFRTYTEEDYDVLAYAMLKYYLSSIEGEEVFHSDHISLEKDMQNLAQKDESFANRYTIYKDFYQKKSNFVVGNLPSARKSR